MKQVLVVDDSELVRKFYRYVLGAAGYGVDAAEDGVMALERLYTRSPDLLITDINMPRMDGFSLIREVRAQPEYDHMPIIIMSTEDGVADRAAGLGLGADVYLVKPAEPPVLLERIRRVLSETPAP